MVACDRIRRLIAPPEVVRLGFERENKRVVTVSSGYLYPASHTAYLEFGEQNTIFRIGIMFECISKS